MPRIEQDFYSEEVHPIDIVETLASEQEWDFDRIADDQIAMSIEGAWRQYALTLHWSGYDETLRLICNFEMEVPDDKKGLFYEALDRANDKLWCGSFTHWREQSSVVFRYGLLLSGGNSASGQQIIDMVSSALSSCERFYPAFQLVCWGDHSPEKALEVAIAETYGRA